MKIKPALSWKIWQQAMNPTSKWNFQSSTGWHRNNQEVPVPEPCTALTCSLRWRPQVPEPCTALTYSLRWRPQRWQHLKSLNSAEYRKSLADSSCPDFNQTMTLIFIKIDLLQLWWLWIMFLYMIPWLLRTNPAMYLYTDLWNGSPSSLYCYDMQDKLFPVQCLSLVKICRTSHVGRGGAFNCQATC